LSDKSSCRRRGKDVSRVLACDVHHMI
jgi:hypothetical protein